MAWGAAARTAGLAQNATPSPAVRIIGMSFAPSPRATVDQRLPLEIAGHDRTDDPAGQHAVDDLQTVRQRMVDAGVGHQIIHHLMESPGDHADRPPVAVQCVDQLQGAGGEMNGGAGPGEHGCRQALQQRHTGAQRLGEIQFPRHGAGRDPRHAVAHSRGLAQQVDDLLVDQRGVHVHDQQSGPRQRRLVKGLQSFFGHTVDFR